MTTVSTNTFSYLFTYELQLNHLLTMYLILWFACSATLLTTRKASARAHQKQKITRNLTETIKTTSGGLSLIICVMLSDVKLQYLTWLVEEMLETFSLMSLWTSVQDVRDSENVWFIYISNFLKCLMPLAADSLQSSRLSAMLTASIKTRLSLLLYYVIRRLTAGLFQSLLAMLLKSSKIQMGSRINCQ